MVIAFVVVSILVPIDVAVTIGALPRIGPTRILFAAVAIGWFLREIFVRRAHAGKRFPLIGFFSLYAGAVLISAAMSPNSARSLYGASNELFEVLLPFYILVTCFRRPGFWPRLKTALFVTTALACLLSFYEEITHSVLYLSFYPPDDLPIRGNLLRVRAFFYHPIAFGCFLALVVPFVVADLIETRSFRRKIMLSALIGAMMVSAFLTVSRGPLFAFLMEIALFVFVGCRARFQRTILALLGAGALLVGGFLLYETNSTTHQSLQSLLNPSQVSLVQVDEESSEYYRIALLKAVVDRLEGANWIYGLGPGTFYISDVTSEYAGQDHVLVAADSLYLRSLLELGILGTAALILLMVQTIRVCVSGLHTRRGPRNVLALAAVSSVLGFVFTNLTVSMFSLWPLALLFWVSPALVLTFPRQNRTTINNV